MLKVVIILILVVMAGSVAFFGIYANQPDLKFKTFGSKVSYSTSQGELFIQFDSNGRVVFRSLVSSAAPTDGKSTDAVVTWEQDGDKRIKWIETASTRRKIVYDKNNIQIFDKTWPKVYDGGTSKNGAPVEVTSLNTEGSQASENSSNQGDSSSGNSTANNGGNDTSSTENNKYPSGYDPFAPENMILIKAHPSGDKMVEWYETLERDYKVKVVKMNGHVVFKKNFPVKRREDEGASSTNQDTGRDSTSSQSGTAAQTPSDATAQSTTDNTVASTASGPDNARTTNVENATKVPVATTPVKPVDPNLQPKPSGQTFKLISKSSSGKGRNMKYVLWYESADWKRKVIKKSGKVVMSFNYPKTPPEPAVKPTVAPEPTPPVVTTVVPDTVAVPTPPVVATVVPDTVAVPTPPVVATVVPPPTSSVVATILPEPTKGVDAPGTADVIPQPTKTVIQTAVVDAGKEVSTENASNGNSSESGTPASSNNEIDHDVTLNEDFPDDFSDSGVSSAGQSATGDTDLDNSVSDSPVETGVANPPLTMPVLPVTSVEWTETETASFKTLVDGNGRVIFRQRIPK